MVVYEKYKQKWKCFNKINNRFKIETKCKLHTDDFQTGKTKTHRINLICRKCMPTRLPGYITKTFLPLICFLLSFYFIFSRLSHNSCLNNLSVLYVERKKEVMIKRENVINGLEWKPKQIVKICMWHGG